MSRLRDRIFRHYTEIMEFLRGLNEKGVTVVMITHDMHLMLEYTPGHWFFADGRLIADRSAAAALCDPQLIRRGGTEGDKPFYPGEPAGNQSGGRVCAAFY